jgi:serine phosphatase RsbU (regulator of sigma subunit)
MNAEYNAEIPRVRILVVDDDAMNRKYFHQVLERQKYLVDEAASGEEAVEQIEKHVYDLILSDLHMYKVGGLDVLQHAKTKDRFTQVVIMTGYGSIPTAVTAMQNGAFDYLSKPVQKDALLVRVQKALREREIYLQLEEQQMRIEAHNRLIERDLELAQKVQASLVPSDYETDRYSIGIHYEPMIGIGGDFCSIHTYDENRFTVNMVDVTGHGIAAALLVNRLSNEMGMILRDEPTMSQILAKTNDFFYNTFSNMGLFLTMFSLHFDLEKMALTFAGGAHPAALLLSPKRKSLVALMSQNIIIGFLPTESQTFVETARKLESGDRIIVYTDGILEAENSQNSQFGLRGLKHSLQTHLSKPVAHACREIVKDVKHYCSNTLRDDIMLMIIEIK